MKKEHNPTPTIRDIVKMTGLSIIVFSNYLNGKAVKATNKVKIEEAISKLGYVVNEYARSSNWHSKQLASLFLHFRIHFMAT